MCKANCGVRHPPHDLNIVVGIQLNEDVQGGKKSTINRPVPVVNRELAIGPSNASIINCR